MSELFAADSPLLRFLTKVADVMILNLLFVATSIPVVTLGGSLTALHHTAMKLARNEPTEVARDYLQAFRSNLRQGTLLSLTLAGLALVLTAWYVVVEHLGLPALVQLVLYGVLFLVGFRFVIAALFAFPYLATFENSVWEVLNNSRLMSLRHLLASLTVLTLTALPIVITVFYPAVTVYGLLWFAVGFAGVAFVNGVVFTNVFDRYATPAPAVGAQ
ncbi:YesL family protein [Xylanimonas sp. McL0601]|uniref:YesL family protein n=1 Tax=Xylanimonas sp. McL0601 TaxID=3414739 RepID=UPI003CEF1E08